MRIIQMTIIGMKECCVLYLKVSQSYLKLQRKLFIKRLKINNVHCFNYLKVNNTNDNNCNERILCCTT